MPIKIQEAIQGLVQGLRDDRNDDRLQSLYQRFDEKRGLRLITYPDHWTYQISESDWTPEMRIARGIVFDRDWNCLSLPLIKFFNFNQLDVDPIAKWCLTEKIDGVMVQLFYYQDEPIFATRHGIETPPALLAKSLLEPYLQDFRKQIPFEHFTAVFELYAPEFRQPGMLYYGKKPFLTLLGVRDLGNSYYPYYPARRIFQNDTLYENVRVVQECGEFITEKILSLIVNPENQREGYVAYSVSEPDSMIKFKTRWYINRISRIRKITYTRFLKIYEQGGLEAIEKLMQENQDILDDLPILAWFDELKDMIRETKNVSQVYSKVNDIQDIPHCYRWVYYYRYNPEKLEQKFRQYVAEALRNPY